MREVMRRVLRRPGDDVDDAHAVELVQEVARAGVALGEARRLGHEGERLARALRLGALRHKRRPPNSARARRSARRRYVPALNGRRRATRS